MAAGAYAFSKPPDADTLDLELTPTVADIPEDQLTLRQEINHALFVLRQLKQSCHSYVADYFRVLANIAEVGLTGTVAQTAVADKSLKQLKEEIVAADGQVIKNRYAHILGWFAAYNAIGALALYAAVKYLHPGSENKASMFQTLGMTATDLVWLRSYTLAWAGAMAGAWVCFVWRSADISFSELVRVRPDWQTAQIRLLFTGIQTLIIGLLMQLSVMAFKLGNLDTSKFQEDSIVALTVGVLCGYGEKTLPMVLAGKTEGGDGGLLSTFLDKLKGQGTAPLAADQNKPKPLGAGQPQNG